MSKKTIFAILFWSGLGVAAILSFTRYVMDFDPKLPEASGQITDFSIADHSGKFVTAADLIDQITLVGFICGDCRERGAGFAESLRLTRVLSPLKNFRAIALPTKSSLEISEKFSQRLAGQFVANNASWSLLSKPEGQLQKLTREILGPSVGEAVLQNRLYLIADDLRVYGPYAADNSDAMIRLQNDAFNLLRSFQKSGRLTLRN